MIGYRIVLIAVTIGIIPALIIGWWLLKRSKNGRGIKSKLLLVTFFWGVLTAIPASILQIINHSNYNINYFVNLVQQLPFFQDSYFFEQLVTPLLFVALVEEFSKTLGILFSLWFFSKSISASKLNINPGLLAGVLVGLAFGVTENGVYFAHNFVDKGIVDVIPIVMLRFLLSTSAHIIYSGLLGAFLVDGFLEKKLLIKILYFILAIVVPVGIHTLFDVLVSTAYGILVVPLIGVGFLLLFFKAFWIFKK